MDVKNKNGQAIGKIDIYYSNNQSIIDHLVSQLKPGMGIGIYIAEATENKISQQTNYKPVKWESDFEQLVSKLAPWIPLFPSYAEIDDIQVFYGFDNLTEQEINEMVSESKSSGKNVVVRELKPNNKLVGININYRKDMEMFRLRVFGTTKSRIQVPDHTNHKIKQLLVRNNEGFYITDDRSQQLVWIEEDINGKALQYEVIAENTDEIWMNSIVASMK